ncbi:MAG: IS5/IS1182 family transposase, partial [Anaerolineae bacterium]
MEFNRQVARVRVPVEHSINQMRRYRALTQMDRHHRCGHTRRTVAVAGLVHRQLEARKP